MLLKSNYVFFKLVWIPHVLWNERRKFDITNNSRVPVIWKHVWGEEIAHLKPTLV